MTWTQVLIFDAWMVLWWVAIVGLYLREARRIKRLGKTVD